MQNQTGSTFSGRKQEIFRIPGLFESTAPKSASHNSDFCVLTSRYRLYRKRMPLPKLSPSRKASEETSCFLFRRTETVRRHSGEMKHHAAQNAHFHRGRHCRIRLPSRLCRHARHESSCLEVRGWPECLARQTDYQLSVAATNDTRSLSRYYIRGAPVQP